MARVPIKASMCSPVNGSGLVGIECSITKHVPGGALGGGEAAKIYLSETEGSQVSGNTVLTDSRGELTQGESTQWAEYWLLPGSYDFYWHGSGTKPFYVVKEMISAGPEGIGTEQIAGEAVTEGKIATGAVSEAKLGEEAIGSSKLKALAVTVAKIASGAVTAAKLAAEAVETAAIKAEAVTGSKIAAEAVGETRIAAKAVTANKLGSGTIRLEQNSSNQTFLSWGIIWLTPVKGEYEVIPTASSGDFSLSTAAGVCTVKWTKEKPVVEGVPAYLLFVLKYKASGIPELIEVAERTGAGFKVKGESGQPIMFMALGAS